MNYNVNYTLLMITNYNVIDNKEPKCLLKHSVRAKKRVTLTKVIMLSVIQSEEKPRAGNTLHRTL